MSIGKRVSFIGRDAVEPKAPKPDWDADDYLARGVLGAIVAGIVMSAAISAGSEGWIAIGWVGSIVAGLLLSIGVVAKGVQVGHRK